MFFCESSFRRKRIGLAKLMLVAEEICPFLKLIICN